MSDKMTDEEDRDEPTGQKPKNKKERAEILDDEDENEDAYDDENEGEGEDEGEDEEDDITRINFTVPKRMKVKWQDMAKNMATSISQLIRNAVQAYGRDIEQDLKAAGEEIERAGLEMENAFRDIDELEGGGRHPERPPRGASGTRGDAAGRGRAADPLDQLRKLKELLDMGAITDEEFKAKKAKLLDMV